MSVRNYYFRSIGCCLWRLFALGRDAKRLRAVLTVAPPTVSKDRRRNFFPINAPDMGRFKLFDLVGYS